MNIKVWLGIASGLALVALLPIVPYALGAATPTVQSRIGILHLPAPPDAVWLAMVDWSGAPEWRRGVERTEPMSEGLGWLEHGEAGVSRHTVVTAEPNRRLVLNVVEHDSSTPATWTFVLTATSDGTRLAITEERTVPSAWDRFALAYLRNPQAAIDDYLVRIANHFGRFYIGPNDVDHGPVQPPPTAKIARLKRLDEAYFDVDGYILDLAWLADGSGLAALTNKEEVVIWKASSGTIETRVKVRPHESNDLVLAADGSWVKVGPGQIAFDLPTGIAVRATSPAKSWLDVESSPTPTGPKETDQPCRTALGPEGKWVAATYKSDLLRVERRDGTLAATATAARCAHLAWQPGGGGLAVGRGAAVRLFEVGAEGELSEREPLGRHLHGVVGLSVSADGRRLLSHDHAGLVLAWDLTSSSRARRLRDMDPGGMSWDDDRYLDNELFTSSAKTTFAREHIVHMNGRGKEAEIVMRAWENFDERARDTLGRWPRQMGGKPGGPLVAIHHREVSVVYDGEPPAEMRVQLPRALSRDGTRYLQLHVADLAPSSSGYTFAGAGNGTDIAIYNAHTHARLVEADLPKDANICAFSPDDTEVACVGHRWVAVADVASGRQKLHAPINGSGADQIAVGFGHVAVLSNGRAIVIELSTARRQWQIETSELRAYSLALASPPNVGPAIVLGDGYGRIFLLALDGS